MNYKKAFHKAYLKQQNLKVTKDNIELYSIDEGRMVLLDETDKYWIVKLLDDSQAGEFIDVIYKHNFEMRTIDI